MEGKGMAKPAKVTKAPKREATVEAMSAAGLRAFARIAGLWGLSVEEQIRLLGEPPRSTFFAWRKNPEKVKLSRDVLERISNILGIYKSLAILLPDDKAADAWIRKPNEGPIFGGKAALDRMLAGNVSDLNLVRRYLDAQRGGGWS
jgi:antitoxin Xre/MbcA/ParS-like protein